MCVAGAISYVAHWQSQIVNEYTLSTLEDSDPLVSDSNVRTVSQIRVFRDALSLNSLTVHGKKHRDPCDIVYVIVGSTSTKHRIRKYAKTWCEISGVRCVFQVDRSFPVHEFPNAGVFKVLHVIFKQKPIMTYSAALAFVRVFDDENYRECKWFVTVDDDTIVNVRNLRAVLDTFDSNDEYFFGGRSEDKRSELELGPIAFGGAGIVLSSGYVKKQRDEYVRCLHNDFDREASLLVDLNSYEHDLGGDYR